MSSTRDSVLTKSFRKEVELLSRHVQLLNVVRREGPIGIVRLSSATGLPQHKVRYSLRILQEEDYIEPTTKGAAATARTEQFLDHVADILDAATADMAALKAEIEESNLRLRQSQ